MDIRERIEADEQKILCSRAFFSCNSAGRAVSEPQDMVRTCFMRDRDRIIHAKAFRRLKHKTQVFISPVGDHYRTRLTHTLEVSQISRTIARALRLNEDLTEAIALGHDLGHTPFGHAGEKALSDVCDKPFKHNEQSVRVLTTLEKDGRGLNLSCEVLNGILCHTGEGKSYTQEGRIIHFADRIGYLNHDLDDAIRGNIIGEQDVPSNITDILGNSHSKRINTLVNAVIDYGQRELDIGLAPTIENAMEALRDFMFEAVYRNPRAKGEESRGIGVLMELFRYFSQHVEAMPPEYGVIAQREGVQTAVCDYVAGMTDGFAIAKFQDIFIPKSWSKL